MLSEGTLSPESCARLQTLREESSPNLLLKDAVIFLEKTQDDDDFYLRLLLCLTQPLKPRMISGTDLEANNLTMLLSHKLQSQTLDDTTVANNYKLDSLSLEVLIACIEALSCTWNCSLDEKTLVCLAAYTDARNSWTTEAASYIASHILEIGVKHDEKDDFITRAILQNYLRKLFAHTPRKKTGSRAHTNLQGYINSDTPLWKQRGPRTLAIILWALKSSTEEMTRSNWPLLNPVILTVSEDADPSIRAAGLEIMTVFLSKCPLATLEATGLDKVYQDAIFPSLLYLPSLTPEEESVQLMKRAYRALLVMAQKNSDISNVHRRYILDKVVRDGILIAYGHASHYILIIETLMETTSLVLESLGLYSIKHLQSIITMISSVLTDPFIISHTSAIVAAIGALKTLVITCWPRISGGGTDEEILRIVSVCWVNWTDELQGSNGGQDDSIKEALVHLVQVLRTVREDVSNEHPSDVGNALKKEPRLKELLFHY